MILEKIYYIFGKRRKFKIFVCYIKRLGICKLEDIIWFYIFIYVKNMLEFEEYNLIFLYNKI